MKKPLLQFSIVVLAGLLLSCTHTDIISQAATERCASYRDSGTQERIRIITDIATGYPVVRIFCTHDDALAWAENVVNRGKASENQNDQSMLTTDIIQTAGALVLLPVDQRTILLNGYPQETRTALRTLVAAMSRLQIQINRR